MKKNIWVIPVSVIFIVLSATGCSSKSANSSERSTTSISDSTEGTSVISESPQTTSDISKSSSNPLDSSSISVSDISSLGSLGQLLQSTLHSNSSDSTESILYFFSGDYENNGETEAFAFVGDPKPDNITQTFSADVWYVDKNGAQKILEGKSYNLNPIVAVSDKKRIVIAEEFYGGSGSVSHAFTVHNGKPVQLENAGENLKQAADAGSKDFYMVKPAFDNGTEYITKSDGTKSELNTGHTWKRYYLYFDGISFKEYGGIKITQSQLERAKGGKDAVNFIKQAGYQIGDIFYRANGIININCSKTTGSGDDVSTTNENVTLVYKDGGVNYVSGSDSQANDYVQKSTYGGIYAAAACPSVATYPKSFPQ